MNKTVYRGQLKPSNELVAIKSHDLDNENDLLLLLNEITRLKQLKHENIQQIYSSYTKGTKLYTIYPFMSFGSCKDILEYQEGNKLENAFFNEQTLQIISKSILKTYKRPVLIKIYTNKKINRY